MGQLQALELLVLTAREGSFSAAGRRAGLSPASVSRHIGELESTLGVQLINRSTRHLALTDAGRIYRQHAEQILHSIEDAAAAANALQKTPRGMLRVHSRLLFGITVLTPLLPLFQKLYPELKVELSLTERLGVLREHEFDVDMQIVPPRDPNVMQRRLLTSERILVASPDYVARMPKVRSPADLLRHNCLTYWVGQDEVTWKFLLRGKLTEMVVPSSFICNNGYALIQLAVLGQGVALLDDYTVANEIAAKKLVRLLPGYRVTNTTFDEGIFATYLQANYLPQKIRVFIDFLVENVPLQVRKRVR